MPDGSTLDTTDVQSTDDSESGGVTSTLSDLATSALGDLFHSAAQSVGKGIGNVVTGATTSPAPDLAAKAATPGAVKTVSSSAVAIPVVLVGGALLALLLLKGR